MDQRVRDTIVEFIWETTSLQDIDQTHNLWGKTSNKKPRNENSLNTLLEVRDTKQEKKLKEYKKESKNKTQTKVWIFLQKTKKKIICGTFLCRMNYY